MTNNFEMPKMSTVENELRAEIERLTKERDEARKECRDYRNRLVAHLHCIQRINSIPTEYHLPWENKTDE